MNVRDWKSFIRDGTGTTLRLAQVSDEMAAAVGASDNIVRMEHSYAVKCAEKHGMLPEHFPALDDTIDRGAVLLDGTRHLVFFWFDDFVWKRWFRVTVKRCDAERRLWFSTFHKTEFEQVRGKMRRLAVLRPLK